MIDMVCGSDVVSMEVWEGNCATGRVRRIQQCGLQGDGVTGPRRPLHVLVVSKATRGRLIGGDTVAAKLPVQSAWSPQKR